MKRALPPPLEYRFERVNPVRRDWLIAGSAVLVAGMFGAAPFTGAFGRVVQAVPFGLGYYAAAVPWVYAWVAIGFIRSRRVGVLGALLVYAVMIAGSVAQDLYLAYRVVSVLRPHRPHPWYAFTASQVWELAVAAAGGHVVGLFFCGFWAVAHPPRVRNVSPGPPDP